MDSRIGPRLRALRLARKLTQKNLALLSGISQQHLSLLEQGRGGVELTTLQKLLDALGHELSFTPRAATPAAGLAARVKQWDAVAEWDASRERTGGASLSQAGALADFYLSQHGATPTKAELRAQAKRIGTWRELLAQVRLR